MSKVTIVYPEEHIFVPLAGSTAVRCSCGREFSTSDEANQHRWWQLQLAVATKQDKENKKMDGYDGSDNGFEYTT